MRQRAFILFAVLGLILPSAMADELTPKEASDARKIYVAKCAKCHELYDPKAYTGPEWSDWMKKMGKKSKLKPEQLQLLVRYTDTLRPSAKP